MRAHGLFPGPRSLDNAVSPPTPDLPFGASSRALMTSKSPDVTIDSQVLRQRIATSTSTRRAVPTAPSGDGLLFPTRKIIPMTQALSFYLDALRFPAALTVFVSHYAGGRFSGGLFWQVMPYGRIAVIAVLRTFGFWHRLGANLEEYALGRVARLYSVIVPAFGVTWALDSLAMTIDPCLYGPGWGRAPIHDFSGYVLSALFPVRAGPCPRSLVPIFLFGRSTTRLGTTSCLALQLFFMDGNEFWR